MIILFFCKKSNLWQTVDYDSSILNELYVNSSFAESGLFLTNEWFLTWNPSKDFREITNAFYTRKVIPLEQALCNSSSVQCFLRMVRPTKFKANKIANIEQESCANQT